MSDLAFVLPVGTEQTDQTTTASETTQSKIQKRIQNRLYKRASRSRHGIINKKTKDDRRQYHVNRWRLDEQRQNGSLSTPKIQGTLANQFPDTSLAKQDIRKDDLPAIWFPLPADHLLHLIKENVMRGLLQNKSLINNLTVPSHAPGVRCENHPDSVEFIRHSAILPIAPQYPGALEPTPVQMNVNHFSWIDYLPCPIMRENLIRREFEFNHAEFVEDLVGTLINPCFFMTAPLSSALPEIQVMGGDNDTESTSETGFVIWGEPYLISSWELTPSFLRKWGWTAVNCHGLVDSTNHWRRLRGEGTLILSLVKERG